MKILHIKTSPRGKASRSTRLAESFLGELAGLNVDQTTDEIDVWSMDLLPFDGAALEAKYADLEGRDLTDDQKAVWSQIDELGDRFRSADVILISVPMWNFGIPYRLKHLLDVVSQRGVLFSFGAEGMVGLLRSSRMVICATRGLALGPDFPEEDFDHQIAYLRTWGRMVGIRDVAVILSQATLGGPEVAESNMAAALTEVRAAAEAVKLARA